MQQRGVGLRAEGTACAFSSLPRHSVQMWSVCEARCERVLDARGTSVRSHRGCGRCWGGGACASVEGMRHRWGGMFGGKWAQIASVRPLCRDCS